MEALGLVAIGFVGTVVWVVNPEATTALYVARRGWLPALVVLLVAVGQAGAHAVLFAAGDQVRRRWRWFDRQCERARVGLGRLLSRGAWPVALASGLVGLPPSSATAALAPGLGLRAGSILPLLFAMRVVRLSIIAALVTGL